jgi:hypothetical protein
MATMTDKDGNLQFAKQPASQAIDLAAFLIAWGSSSRAGAVKHRF